MNKTNLIAAVMAVLLLAGAVGFWGYTTGLGSGSAEPAKQTQENEAVSIGKLVWSFEEIEAKDEESAPQTSVTLTVEGTDRKHNVGTYDGNCSVIEASSWPLLENEKTGVICWWAGGGSEIGVFEESGKLVVKVGELEEATEETDGVRGNFKLLFPFN